MTDNAGLAHGVTARSPFPSLANAWLDELQADPKLSKGTKTVYESGLRTLLLPAFADSVVKDLTRARIERFLRGQRAKSHAVARLSKLVLGHVIRYAMRQGALTDNPLIHTSPVCQPEARPEDLTLEEIAALRVAASRRGVRDDLDDTTRHLLADVIDLMLSTRVTIGQALGVRACDLDMRVGPPVIHLHGTVVRHGNGTEQRAVWEATYPVFVVTPPEPVVDALCARIAGLESAEPDQLIFATASGAPINIRDVRRSFRHILQLAGLGKRGITLHTLHRAANVLIEKDAGWEEI